MTTYKKQVIKRCILTFITLLIIIFIFMQSMKNAAQSAAQSGRVLAFLNSVLSALGFGITLTHSFVRTCAHFSEFALLGASLTAMYKSYNIRVGLIPLYSIISSAFIALSDECIQLLSDGRAFQFMDILIDISGALAGTIFIVIFILILNRNKKRIK